MKRIAILTSLLALTACGGGSGGGGSGAPGDIVKPASELTAEQRAAAIASNSKITDMDSFIVVGGTNPTVNSNARAAGIKQDDGGVRYDLSNVEFQTATQLMTTDSPDRAIVTFETNDGKIDKIVIDNAAMHVAANRDGDENTFSGNYEVEFDGDIETGKLAVQYNSLGKEHKTGLKYADFGIIEWGDTKETYDTTNYMAGGYEVKEIKSADIVEKMEFAGVADATVRIGDWSDESANIEGFNTKTDAHVVFENGVSTLTANFTDWYDVTAKMDSTGNLTSLEFANGDKAGFHQSDTEGNNFKWHNQDNYVAQKKQDIPRPDLGDDITETIERDGFIQYYGDGKNPAEAVGVIRYGDSNGMESTKDNHVEAMRFDMGFGVKRQ